jgi:glycosyltransferase involved in cell wall biosynthesis
LPDKALKGVTEAINTEALAPNISVGIIAWNEADSIGACLESVFRQSLFSKLHGRKLTCEIICLANGCTDDTSDVAQRSFDAHGRNHPFKNSFTSRLVNLGERGKLNAWNVFVHKLSSPQAQFLCLMDADILVHHPDTLWNMVALLLHHPQAAIAVDRPLKDISFKAHPSVLERISLATSATTQARAAQVTGQLYLIRAVAARNIFMPKDLPACEDGFIKTVICTDFLTRPAFPARIMQADDASHVFEAYSSIGDILKNQKRQMIGQTIVHVLVDKYLQRVNLSQRPHLGEFISDLERTDPTWLKRLSHEHIRMTRHCWQLFPGILRSRFRPLARMRGIRRALYLPVALIGFFVTLISCWRAFRALKQGCTNYWPDSSTASRVTNLINI